LLSPPTVMLNSAAETAVAKTEMAARAEVKRIMIARGDFLSKMIIKTLSKMGTKS